MLDTELHVGMDWVVRTLRALGHGQGVDIRPIGWDPDTVNLKASRHHFVVSLNGQRRVVTFDDADLEDVRDDPRVQILIEGDLLAFLSDDCADGHRPDASPFP